MITRPYNNSDFKGASALFLKVFKSTQFNYEWLTEDSVNRYFLDMVNTPKFSAFILWDEGNNEILGACFGFINDYFLSSYYEIKEIFVSPDIQRNGAGSFFLNGIEKILKIWGTSSITLSTERTIPAYNFYKKNGYLVSENSVYMFKQI